MNKNNSQRMQERDSKNSKNFRIINKKEIIDEFEQSDSTIRTNSSLADGNMEEDKELPDRLRKESDLAKKRKVSYGHNGGTGDPDEKPSHRSSTKQKAAAMINKRPSNAHLPAEEKKEETNRFLKL